MWKSGSDLRKHPLVSSVLSWGIFFLTYISTLQRRREVRISLLVSSRSGFGRWVGEIWWSEGFSLPDSCWVYKFSCGLTEVSLVVNAFSEYLCSEFYMCHLKYFWKYCGWRVQKSVESNWDWTWSLRIGWDQRHNYYLDWLKGGLCLNVKVNIALSLAFLTCVRDVGGLECSFQTLQYTSVAQYWPQGVEVCSEPPQLYVRGALQRRKKVLLHFFWSVVFAVVATPQWKLKIYLKGVLFKQITEGR